MHKIIKKNESQILVTQPSVGYELLDSGGGEKLERFGNIIVARPDPQSLWQKNLSPTEWQKADATFSGQKENGGWSAKKNFSDRWQINFGGLDLWLKLSAFKHVGLFPEQLSNWEWCTNLIKNSGRKISVLNLFAYTGAATLAALKAGAEVCHLDASKTAINWAKDNTLLSGLEQASVRWIVDDALAFLKREVKRGHFYDAIIMDPPAFGHGPNNELWKIEKNFLELVNLCFRLTSKNPLFVLMNGYASGYSAIAYQNNLLLWQNKFGGQIEVGELTIAESNGQRLLPAGIFARFHS